MVSTALLLVIIIIILVSIAFEAAIDANLISAKVGRELHAGSFSLILPSFFSAPDDPRLMVLVILASLTFGLTILCVAGANDKLPTKWCYFERAALVIGVAVFSTGIGAATLFWP